MERQARESPRRIALVAAAIAAAYYAGAHLGFILRLPPTTPSILWPPNAILTAALLLTPPRRWWIWILAVFPAHLLVELEADFPPLLVLALFVTNWSEALIGAAGVRAFSDAPRRLDTLYRMLVFVVMSGLLAPFLSSFLDAGAVTLIRGEDYWQVWRTRFFSNVLSQLALVPALLTLATGGRRWLREAGARAHLEAAVLSLTVIVLATVVFGLSSFASTPLAFLLPLLMVAAVRFGPAGAGLSVLAVTLVAVWTGTYQKGPFAHLAQAEGVLAVQLYLSVVAIPIYGPPA
jgi:integral membrane sensor domain MASE1